MRSEMITQMLAAALRTEQRHAAELQRRDELHIAETGRRDELHVDDLHRRDDVHAHQMEMIRETLETRDIIGQAPCDCSGIEIYRFDADHSVHQRTFYELPDSTYADWTATTGEGTPSV